LVGREVVGRLVRGVVCRVHGEGRPARVVGSRSPVVGGGRRVVHGDVLLVVGRPLVLGRVVRRPLGLVGVGGVGGERLVVGRWRRVLVGGWWLVQLLVWCLLWLKLLWLLWLIMWCGVKGLAPGPALLAEGGLGGGVGWLYWLGQVEGLGGGGLAEVEGLVGGRGLGWGRRLGGGRGGLGGGL